MQAHPRARAEPARRRVPQRVEKLGVDAWVKMALDSRVIRAAIPAAARARQEQLNGWYVLHTNVARRRMDADTVHARDKNLAQVEEAFRTTKTAYPGAAASCRFTRTRRRRALPWAPACHVRLRVDSLV